MHLVVRKSWFAILSLLMLLLFLAGCGGKSLLPSASVPESPSGVAASGGTATFHVDVATGQVSITPLPGTRGDGAVFAGNTIGFSSSVLLDQSGAMGRKVLNVILANKNNEPIGETPDGIQTGVEVRFSNLTNVSSLGDIRNKTTVNTFAGSGDTGFQSGPLTFARFNQPVGMATDGYDTLYVADSFNQCIRRIQQGVVTDVAGASASGYQDGIGTNVRFNRPYGLAWHAPTQTLVIAEYSGQRLRRLDPVSGRVTTIAGTGSAGDTDGLGSVAAFRNPAGIAVGSDGAIYVAETGGHRIRKVVCIGDPTQPTGWMVTTVAGNGTAGLANGPVASARFNGCSGVAVGPSGELYVADSYNAVLRYISPDGQVTTLAGIFTGSATEGRGDEVRFTMPTGISYVGGSLLVTDTAAHTLRRCTLLSENATPTLARNWVVQTLAGEASTSGSTSGAGNLARFNSPRYLAIDSHGAVYLADTSNYCIRRVTVAGEWGTVGVSSGAYVADPVTLANPDGYAGVDDRPYLLYPGVLKPGESANKSWVFDIPSGVTAFEFTVTVTAGTQFVAKPGSAAGAGSPDVLVSTFAGKPGQGGYADGILSAARFLCPTGIARDQAGNLYIADDMNFVIRRISTTGIVSTVRGVGHCDGGFAVTPDGRTIYVAEYQTNSIVRIALTGSDPTRPEHWSASVIAGANVGEGYANGNGSVARFTTPEGLAIDAVGNLYCSERGNRLRRLVWTGGDPSIATNWHVTSIAGSEFGTAGDTDGQGWWAHFRNPQGLACDLAGNIYLADSGNHRIRKVTPAGNVTTFAGSTAGYQDGVGSGAQFNNPVDVSVDAAGYVYVVDFGNRRIRCISPSGKVTTVAGTGTNGTLDGPGNVAQFNYPYACEATPSGALYVVANGESTIRLIQRIISAP